MTKYEIMTDHFEFRVPGGIDAMSGAEIMDTYFSCDTRITSNSLDPTREETFEDIDEATAFFNAHYGNYGSTRLQRGNVGYLLTGEIAWLEENEYDEDGEFDQGGDVVCFSAEDYRADDEED